MIAARRTLRIIGDEADIPVVVTLDVPEEDDRSWRCEFEIGWPDQPLRRRVLGVDGVQALSLAMGAVAFELYRSDYHRVGLLIFEESTRGYGFPVPLSIRGEAVGMDTER